MVMPALSPLSYMIPSDPLPIFVYGTLRREAAQHHRLAGATFLGSAQLPAKLYQVDWYPALIYDPTSETVTGELYEVTPTLLRSLDAYEGDEYSRRQRVVHLEHGNTHRAWVWEWLGSIEALQPIPHGDWLRQTGQGRDLSS